MDLAPPWLLAHARFTSHAPVAPDHNNIVPFRLVSLLLSLKPVRLAVRVLEAMVPSNND